MLLRYLYTISKICASKSNFVFFDIGDSLLDPAWAAVDPTRYWTQIAVCAHCIANQSSPVAHAPPGPPSAAAAEPALGGTVAPAASAAAPAAAAGAAFGPAEYVSWSERSGTRTRTSRVRQAEPGSRVTVAVTAVGKAPVAAYCEPQPWSEPWEQPEFVWRRRLVNARYAQPSTECRSV